VPPGRPTNSSPAIAATTTRSRLQPDRSASPDDVPPPNPPPNPPTPPNPVRWLFLRGGDDEDNDAAAVAGSDDDAGAAVAVWALWLLGGAAADDRARNIVAAPGVPAIKQTNQIPPSR
jgi:hypothetical protein